MKSPKFVICVSDLHVGSHKGLLHPGFVSHEGTAIGQNEIQKWLWSAWEDCWKWAKDVVGKEDFILVINGDVVDGNHHGSKEIWSVDEGDHLAAAADILVEVGKDAKAVYITEGTESHTKGMEHALAKILRLKGVKVVTDGRRGAWESLHLKVSDSLCEFDHHMPTSMRSYLEASALSITLGDIRNQRARSGAESPRVIVRSHRHRFGLYEDGYGMMVALPAWQGLTRFGRKVVPGAMPQCGLVILDWRGSEGNCTPTVHKRLHTIKPPTPRIA